MTLSATLTGPTLAAARGPATHLLVLVHGYGADGQDLIGLASHWQGLLPSVAFAAPNAPMRIPGGPGTLAALRDLTAAETAGIVPLIALALVIGILPRFLLDLIEPAARTLTYLVAR